MPELLEVFLTSYFDAAWCFQLAVISLSWVILCYGILWEKEKRFRIVLQFLLLTISMAVCDVAIMLIPNAPFTIFWNLAHGVISAVYVALCYHCHRKAKTVLWCSMFAGAWSLTAIAGQLSFLMGNFIGTGLPEALIRCVIYSLMIPLAFFLRSYNFDDYKTVPQSGMRLIFVGDLCMLLLSLAEIPFIGTGHEVVISLLIANVCMLIVMMLVINAVYTMCKGNAEILALQAETQRMATEQELVRLTESNLEDLRCIRHDLKNQFAYMKLLLHQKNYEELDAYFNQQVENASMPVSYIDCGNRIIDNVLNMELAKAKRAGIRVEHQLVVPPELPFADDDVCAILANLLDNAIEECKRLQKDSEVSIRLTMHPHGSYLYIMCRNTTDREKLDRVNNALMTTKHDTRLHGYGTRIVAKTAEKYNGSVDYSLKEGQFVAKVIMDLMVGEEM